MRGLCVTVVACGLLLATAVPATASNELTEAEIERISAVLAAMQCEMDDDDIEKEGDGYELDDVICTDGQYDMQLDADFNVIEKRAE